MNKKLLVTALAIAVFILNTTNFSDKSGHEYLNKSIKNAAATFLVARGINGIISVFQDIDVSTTPFGVGISLSPGEILDPFNDLIERFSSIMLLATAALGIQKILLIFSGWWVTKALIDILLVVSVISYLFGKLQLISETKKIILYRSLILLLSIRFIVPFIAISSGVFDSIFINDSVVEKTASLRLIEKTSRTIETTTGSEENGWVGNMRSKAKEIGDLPDKAVLLKEKLSDSVGDIVDLIALFIVQTIVLPLTFLYFSIKIFKFLFGYDLSRYFSTIENKQNINNSPFQNAPL